MKIRVENFKSNKDYSDKRVVLTGKISTKKLSKLRESIDGKVIGILGADAILLAGVCIETKIDGLEAFIFDAKNYRDSFSLDELVEVPFNSDEYSIDMFSVKNDKAIGYRLKEATAGTFEKLDVRTTQELDREVIKKPFTLESKSEPNIEEEVKEDQVIEEVQEAQVPEVVEEVVNMPEESNNLDDIFGVGMYTITPDDYLVLHKYSQASKLRYVTKRFKGVFYEVQHKDR